MRLTSVSHPPRFLVSPLEKENVTFLSEPSEVELLTAYFWMADDGRTLRGDKMTFLGGGRSIWVRGIFWVEEGRCGYEGFSG